MGLVLLTYGVCSLHTVDQIVSKYFVTKHARAHYVEPVRKHFAPRLVHRQTPQHLTNSRTLLP
jgi:hypothetical protein